MSSCIFTVIKNEHEYLDEWIKYHLDLGIDHIFIAEDYGSETHKTIAHKYPIKKVTLLSVLDLYKTEEQKQRIIYEKTHLFKLQNAYFRNGLKYVKNNYDYDWCFIIDNDEYITFEKKDESIQNIMSKYNEYDAVVLQWENYGANGHVYKPNYKEKNIIDTYTTKVGYQLSDDDKWYQKVKTVYNMNVYDDTFMSDRLPKYESKWCKTNFSQDKEKLIYDNIYIRHYITKSWEEYIWKIYIRGMFNPKHRNIDSFFEMNNDMINKKEELIKIAEHILNKKI